MFFFLFDAYSSLSSLILFYTGAALLLEKKTVFLSKGRDKNVRFSRILFIHRFRTLLIFRNVIEDWKFGKEKE